MSDIEIKGLYPADLLERFKQSGREARPVLTVPPSKEPMHITNTAGFDFTVDAHNGRHELKQGDEITIPPISEGT